MVNFEIYDVTAWLRKNYNTLIANISRIKDNQAMKFGQLIEYKKNETNKKYNKKNIFLQKSCKNEAKKLVPVRFLFF